MTESLRPFLETQQQVQDVAAAMKAATESFRQVQESLDSVARAMDAVRRSSADVLRVLKDYRDLSDAMLALRTPGIGASAVHTYVTGQTVLNVEKMTAFAKALQVPPAIFFETPNNALRWVLDNSPNAEEEPWDDEGLRGRDSNSQPNGLAEVIQLPKAS